MPHIIARVGARLAVALIVVVLAGCGGTQEPRTGATPTASVAAPSTSTASEGVTSPTSASEQTAPPEDCKVKDRGPDDPPRPTFAPAPADVSGMLGWLATSCPGAAWLPRIQKIEYVPGEVPDSGGFANAIVITTDLEFATEQAVALEIGLVLGEAHPSWASQFVVWYADGHNETAGDIIDMTP